MSWLAACIASVTGYLVLHSVASDSVVLVLPSILAGVWVKELPGLLGLIRAGQILRMGLKKIDKPTHILHLCHEISLGTHQMANPGISGGLQLC